MIHSTAKQSEHVYRKCPHNQAFTTFSLLHQPIPSNSSPLEWQMLEPSGECIKNIPNKWTYKSSTSGTVIVRMLFGSFSVTAGLLVSYECTLISLFIIFQFQLTPWQWQRQNRATGLDSKQLNLSHLYYSTIQENRTAADSDTELATRDERLNR